MVDEDTVLVERAVQQVDSQISALQDQVEELLELPGTEGLEESLDALSGQIDDLLSRRQTLLLLLIASEAF